MLAKRSAHSLASFSLSVLRALPCILLYVLSLRGRYREGAQRSAEERRMQYCILPPMYIANAGST